MNNSDLDANLKSMEFGGLDGEMISVILHYCESKNGMGFWETELREGFTLSDVAIRSLIKVADRGMGIGSWGSLANVLPDYRAGPTYADSRPDLDYMDSGSQNGDSDSSMTFVPSSDSESSQSSGTKQRSPGELGFLFKPGAKRQYEESMSDAPSKRQRMNWSVEGPAKGQTDESLDLHPTHKKINDWSFGGLTKRQREESPDFHPAKRQKNPYMTQEQREKQKLFFD
jgi:hypothetical protein